MNERTHASFFSGAGGLDLGLERAGWRTVSYSEVDPYACSVLERHWPGVPQLGDITRIDPAAIPAATLWTGGFPCQDLSTAGYRRGMGAGTRSGLAYAFLDLAAVRRPRIILLENVPGLLSSHAGRDMAALVGALVDIGYGVGWRVLDAQFFGVPQHRRRVFIVADAAGGRAGAERAAEVLSVGSRCRRHPAAGLEGRDAAAGLPGRGAGVIGALAAGLGHHGNAGASAQAVQAGHVVVQPGVAGGSDGDAGPRRAHRRGGAPPDSAGVRAGDGLAGRVDAGAVSDPRDSHRLRCCGNGVVAPVGEWLGQRLAAAL